MKTFAKATKKFPETHKGLGANGVSDSGMPELSCEEGFARRVTGEGGHWLTQAFAGNGKSLAQAAGTQLEVIELPHRGSPLPFWCALSYSLFRH